MFLYWRKKNSIEEITLKFVSQFIYLLNSFNSRCAGIVRQEWQKAILEHFSGCRKRMKRKLKYLITCKATGNEFSNRKHFPGNSCSFHFPFSFQSSLKMKFPLLPHEASRKNIQKANQHIKKMKKKPMRRVKKYIFCYVRKCR